jgi:hypothetical protein
LATVAGGRGRHACQGDRDIYRSTGDRHAQCDKRAAQVRWTPAHMIDSAVWTRSLGIGLKAVTRYSPCSPVNVRPRYALVRLPALVPARVACRERIGLRACATRSLGAPRAAAPQRRLDVHALACAREQRGRCVRYNDPAHRCVRAGSLTRCAALNPRAAGRAPRAGRQCRARSTRVGDRVPSQLLQVPGAPLTAPPAARRPLTRRAGLRRGYCEQVLPDRRRREAAPALRARLLPPARPILRQVLGSAA